MNPLKKILFSFANNCAGFLFPPLCIKCKNKTSGTGLASWLCGSCISALQDNLSMRTKHACPLCSQNLRLKACSCALEWAMPYEMSYSIFDFDDTLKTVVHEFKYNGFKRLAFDMGKEFSYCIPSSFFEDFDMVTSVPLHFLRRLKRGYNQADYFARGVMEGCGCTLKLYPDLIRRKRATKTQTNLSRKDRLKNVAGAFSIIKKKQTLIRNKSVILVDDVVTTGATTAQCAKVLCEAGAKSVRVLSLARD
jgi:competence protein ComFC